jgi:hypothetical protein
MDVVGQIAESAHVAAGADCLHAVREYITVPIHEILKGQYPLCDFNLVNGEKHRAITMAGKTFGYCTKCLLVMCPNCDMQISRASVLFLTGFNIFPNLLSNSQKILLSVFVKHRSVTTYVFVGLCSLFILFFSFDFNVISCDAPRA